MIRLWEIRGASKKSGRPVVIRIRADDWSKACKKAEAKMKIRDVILIDGSNKPQTKKGPNK